MSRANYNDDLEQWALIRWRGAVASAIRGKRGQAFLRELLAALDALPTKRLVARDLEDESGEVCALGAVGRARGLNMDKLDPYDYETVCGTFGIAGALGREIMFQNDDCGSTPEKRFAWVRAWIVEQLRSPESENDA